MERSLIDNSLNPMPKLVFGTVQANLRQNISKAIELNYRHIDGADAYVYSYSDRNEYFNIIKYALKIIPRNQIWLTWKSDRITIENIRSIINKLECSYIDLFLVHHTCGTEEDFVVFKQAREEKLIRFYGVSNCENIETIRHLQIRHNIFANQIQARSPNGKINDRQDFSPEYNFNDFIRECNRLGIAIMLFSSVSGITNSLAELSDYKIIERLSSVISFINPYYFHKYIFNAPIPIPDSEPIVEEKLLRHIENLKFSINNPNTLIVSSSSLRPESLRINMQNFDKMLLGQNLLTYSEFINVEDILESFTLAHM